VACWNGHLAVAGFLAEQLAVDLQVGMAGTSRATSFERAQF
jgi:hypothetical protein